MADTVLKTDLDDKIAASIPTETYYEDYYLEMSKEAEMLGDNKSSRILKYISDDEKQHHDLLKSMQCERHPEKCEYGLRYDSQTPWRLYLFSKD